MIVSYSLYKDKSYTKKQLLFSLLIAVVPGLNTVMVIFDIFNIIMIKLER